MARDQSFGGLDRTSPAGRRAGVSEGSAGDGMLAAFAALPVPTAITRAADGVIVFANPPCLELLGWQEHEFVGRTMLDVGFWASPERRAEMLDRLAVDGCVRDLEEEVTTSGGAARIVLTSISRIDLDGEPCLIGHIHDITERRRLEREVREGEERFRQVTETFQQAFILSELDPPRVLYASPAVARVFGVGLDDLYRNPRTIQRLIHPEDRAAVIAARDDMLAARDFEYRIVRPDGETRWIRTRAEPAGTADGRLTRAASVSEDVTNEHALREQLRAGDERFRLLAENSTDVIGRVGPDQRLLYVSPACRTVYRYEPEAMVGRFAYEFIHPEDLAALSEDFSPQTEEHVVTTNTCRVLRGDGTYTWVEAKIRALRDPVSDAVIEFHTVARDVSDRKQAEADVRRAKEEAEHANAAKSEFLSRMSHELRTPLHAILGFGQLLEADELEPHQSEQLEQITRAGRHLLELINEVLDLSRIEGGELHVSLEPVDVGEVVAEALQMLEPLAAARSVTLAQEHPEAGALHVLADRHRLKQILLNLLSNAVKYNREDGSVRVTATRGEHGTARLEVADTGIGIAPGDLALAFEAFERLGAEATDVEGTGLGLALTKRLLETMGGTIGVDSEVGRGTTFWLDLPVVEAAATVPEAAPAAPAAARRTDPRTVLYVEDNPSNIRLVETILRSRPEITLLVAQQGSLGIELAREHRPALVLLDLNLPDYSGEEVLRRLRADPRTAAVTVVVVSADATAGQANRLRAAGANAYLTKPFALEQFLAVIDAPPGSGSAADAAAANAAPSPTEPAIEGPLDPSPLDGLRSRFPDGVAVRELIEMFLEGSAARFEALCAGAAGADAETVRAAAHAWRGSCGVAGAHRLVALLGEIEDLARAGTVPDRERLAAVRSAYNDVREALDEQRLP
jgi:PAS domain S-box-containing protein